MRLTANSTPKMEETDFTGLSRTLNFVGQVKALFTGTDMGESAEQLYPLLEKFTNQVGEDVNSRKRKESDQLPLFGKEDSGSKD